MAALLKVAPDFSSVEPVGSIGLDDVYGLTFGPLPTLHAFREGGEVRRIDPETAATTIVAGLAHDELDDIYGAAVVISSPVDLGDWHIKLVGNDRFKAGFHGSRV